MHFLRLILPTILFATRCNTFWWIQDGYQEQLWLRLGIKLDWSKWPPWLVVIALLFSSVIYKTTARCCCPLFIYWGL